MYVADYDVMKLVDEIHLGSVFCGMWRVFD